jgi:hypothetical protein
VLWRSDHRDLLGEHGAIEIPVICRIGGVATRVMPLALRNRDGFQMEAGWMRVGLLRPGRRLKVSEEGNRGQQRCAMEI